MRGFPYYSCQEIVNSRVSAYWIPILSDIICWFPCSDSPAIDSDRICIRKAPGIDGDDI